MFTIFVFQIFKMRIWDPVTTPDDSEPPCYLEPELEHPLFMEAVDQALALCAQVGITGGEGDGGSPAHLRLVMEWNIDTRAAIVADQSDAVEEHSSVKVLRNQALQGSF